ncbi:MAG: hypothetical protein HC888_02255 [Candidatus Competibacteraceae bacterium]|nr:hypothetical protein [Candidatus Competibacteraceae bacterium]
MSAYAARDKRNATHAMASIKNSRAAARQIELADDQRVYKRAAMDPMALTRNAQLGSMDEDAQVMAVVGMILYPEEFDTVLYAAPSTQDKLCKRGISQRCVSIYPIDIVHCSGSVIG